MLILVFFIFPLSNQSVAQQTFFYNFEMVCSNYLSCVRIFLMVEGDLHVHEQWCHTKFLAPGTQPRALGI